MLQKSILITGCGSGIGYAAALILKQRGYRVFATVRKESDVETLQKQGFESLQLDLRYSQSIHQAVDSILQKTDGKLTALFNNAGYLQVGAFEDLTRNLIRNQFEANTFGPVELTQALLPTFRKQGYGRIIQNSSILGLVTYPYRAAYNASKFALEGFSDTLRQELKGSNIYTSTLICGPIKSQLRQNAHQQYQNSLEKIKNKVHEKAYQKMETSYFNLDLMASRMVVQPDKVVKKLIHALESKSPKAHYYVGFPAQITAFLKRILPDKLLDWTLLTINKNS